MKASANIITFTSQANGLWVCTITGGDERLGNVQQFTNRGTSPRHAYHRARLLRRRTSHVSNRITCACPGCLDWLTESQHTPEDDQVLGQPRTYQRMHPLPASTRQHH